MKWMSVVLTVVLWVVCSAAWGNLLTNGNFDSPGNTNIWTGTGWTPNGNCSREIWAARTGGYGGIMEGWTSNSNGRVYQDVGGLTTGTYTFVVWVKHGVSFNPTDIQLRMEWFNSTISQKYDDVLTNFFPSARVTGNAVWEPIHLTATFTNPAGSLIRARFYCAWGAALTNFGEPLVFDDADLYAGAYVPPTYSAGLTNGNFETPTNIPSPSFQGSGWTAQSMNRTDWAGRSGKAGVWIETYQQGAGTLYQEVAATGGLYTLVMHLRHEVNANPIEGRMLIEWCDADRNVQQTSSKVLTNFSADTLWHQIYLTGSYTNTPAISFVRPRFYLRYGAPLAPGSDAVTLDDVFFYAGAYSNRLLNGSFEDYSFAPWMNWSLEKTGTDPWFQEWKPHDGVKIMAFPCWETNGETVLRQSLFVSPTGTYTFAAWINREIGFGLSNLMIDAKWYDANFRCIQTNTLNILPGIQDWYEYFLSASCPAAGSDTNLYEVMLSARVNWGLRAGENLALLLDDLRFQSGSYTPSYGGSQLQDGGFETPANTNTWALSAWKASGSLYREEWAYRTGGRGVAFESWLAGQGMLYQQLASTGGTWTVSGWFKKAVNAQASNTLFMLEWGGPGGSLLEIDTENLDDVPADGMAHHVYLTGTCTNTGVAFVRPKIWYKFGNPKTNNNEVTYLDDVEFYSGAYTGAASLVNGSFGTSGLRKLWDISPEGFAEIHNWADQSHDGTNGLVFTGWSALPALQPEARVSQTLIGSTGTYVFSVWMKAQLDADLNGAALRIHWYDKDYQKVQPDTVANLLIPRDDLWHTYSVTATCSSVSLHEIIPVVAAGWNKETGEVGIFADQISFATGTSSDEDTDDDGMLDAWELRYFGNLTTAGVSSNYDNDSLTDWQEFVADTVPTNDLSNFDNVSSVISNASVLIVTIGPPTTNSRVYDVWWQTNLVTGTSWTPRGINQPGRSDGGAVTLTVTNEASLRFYRGGVKLP